jgi:two-component system, response regulator YesN
MFNLLIVDDEPFIVEGLAALNWETVGINQVFKATSGKDAIKSIEENQVDIVITDIKMPDITGIELIKQNELGRNKKCILLSGYADFEYAKQAIKYDAFEYLLKPASDDEIYQSVQNAIDE